MRFRCWARHKCQQAVCTWYPLLLQAWRNAGTAWLDSGGGGGASGFGCAPAARLLAAGVRLRAPPRPRAGERRRRGPALSLQLHRAVDERAGAVVAARQQRRRRLARPLWQRLRSVEATQCRQVVKAIFCRVAQAFFASQQRCRRLARPLRQRLRSCTNLHHAARDGP